MHEHTVTIILTTDTVVPTSFAKLFKSSCYIFLRKKVTIEHCTTVEIIITDCLPIQRDLSKYTHTTTCIRHALLLCLRVNEVRGSGELSLSVWWWEPFCLYSATVSRFLPQTSPTFSATSCCIFNWKVPSEMLSFAGGRLCARLGHAFPATRWSLSAEVPTTEISDDDNDDGMEVDAKEIFPRTMVGWGWGYALLLWSGCIIVL